MSAFGSVSQTRMKFACAGCCLLWNNASISLRSTESRHSSRSRSLTRWILSSLKTDCAYRSAQLWVKFISGSRGEPKNQLLLSWIISWATNTHTHAHMGEVVMNGQVTRSAFGASPRHNKPLWAKPPGKNRLQRERWRTREKGEREREEERKRAGEERTRLSLSL